MATIVTRAGKGSPLTNTEVDDNFTNLNTDKLEKSGGTMTGDLSFGDNDKAIFGAGSDLQIYSDGANAVIDHTNTGAGALYLKGDNNVIITNQAGTENKAVFASNGAVTLYYDNAPKLATTSTGIDVTGTVTADGLTVGSTSASNLVTEIRSHDPNNTVNLITNSESGDNLASIDFTNINYAAGGEVLGRILGITNAGSGGRRYGNLIFQTADFGTVSERMRITSSGNVGIGTSSPEALLHVQQNANGPRGIKIENYYGANAAAYLYLTTPNVAGTAESSAYLQKANSDGGLTIANPETDSGSYTRFVQGSSERMRIDSSGCVGIGTSTTVGTAADRALVIYGSGNSGTLFLQDSNSGTGSTNGFSLASSVFDAFLNNRENGNMRFYNNGSERMRIDSSGRVGIGTSSPLSFSSGAYNLVVSAASGSNCGITINNDGTSDLGSIFFANGTSETGKGRIRYDHSSDSLAISTLDTERMRIDSNGNVGIGTSSPAVPLDVNGSAQVSGRILVGSVGSGGGVSQGYQFAGDGNTGMYQDAYDQLQFSTNNAERMRIDSSGNVFVGCTAQVSSTVPGISTIHASGDYWILNIGNTRTTSQKTMRFFNGNGEVGSISTNASATAYNTSSDYRLKEDWQPISGSIDRLKNLNPVNFAWKADGSRVDGFLAHEAAEVVPEAVTGEKDAVDKDGNPQYQGIDQSKLVPLLTAALQEAVAKIEALETRIAALESN